MVDRSVVLDFSFTLQQHSTLCNCKECCCCSWIATNM